MTYNSCEIAVARRPVPKIAVPVLVMRFGEEGSLLMISEARSSGGGVLEDVANVRLDALIARTT